MADHPSFAVVIPTVGREGLPELVRTIVRSAWPTPVELVVVDDRADIPEPLPVPDDLGDSTVRVVHSGGRGPAAARNTGWQSVTADWVVFVDDDVRVPDDWAQQLLHDISGLPDDVAGSQAIVEVPAPDGRRPTDDERRTLSLSAAQWITADMAYRRRALMRVGGFDPAFPNAYREDSDLALRIIDAGYRIRYGRRVVEHPIATGGFFRSVVTQRGNADDARMLHTHGRVWRARAGAGRGRLPEHLATVSLTLLALLGTLTRRRRVTLSAAASAATLTADFARRRIMAGPKTPREISAMLVTSVLIPFAAVFHRVRGEWQARRRPGPLPAAVLFDRDDTLITDVGYLDDPDRVVPVSDAAEALARLRRNGIPTGIISNQSGIGRGLITVDALRRVNARVDRLLGPFDTWQVCPHTPDDHCACRKPHPGLVVQAATDLGVDPKHCVVIGDIGADVEAASAAGATGMMVPTLRTRTDEIQAASDHDCVAATLTEAVSTIMGDRR